MPTDRTGLDARALYRDVYLKSAHWKQVRDLALQRADHRCQVCYSSGKLDVHHRTYKRVGKEEPMDLTVLCRRCHDHYHKLLPKVPGSPAPQKRTSRPPKLSKTQRRKLARQRKADRDKKLAQSMAEMKARNANRPLRIRAGEGEIQ